MVIQAVFSDASSGAFKEKVKYILTSTSMTIFLATQQSGFRGIHIQAFVKRYRACPKEITLWHSEILLNDECITNKMNYYYYYCVRVTSFFRERLGIWVLLLQCYAVFSSLLQSGGVSLSGYKGTCDVVGHSVSVGDEGKSGR